MPAARVHRRPVGDQCPLSPWPLVVAWRRMWPTEATNAIELGVEVRRRRQKLRGRNDVTALAVGSLHHTHWSRVIGSGLDHAGAQHTRKPGHPLGRASTLTDPDSIVHSSVRGTAPKSWRALHNPGR